MPMRGPLQLHANRCYARLFHQTIVNAFKSVMQQDLTLRGVGDMMKERAKSAQLQHRRRLVRDLTSWHSRRHH